MSDVHSIAATVAASFSALPHVVAVAMGGSRTRTAAGADERSDLDLYVFTEREIPLSSRRDIVAALGGAVRAQLDQRFCGLSDQWIDGDTGLHIDVNYFDAGWMRDAVLRVAEGHHASLGYSTCFWYTVAHAVPLADPLQWLAGLKARVEVPYPERLRTNIVALNHPLLRGIYTSYAAQVERAVARGDWVSVNHRIAALLASYFDCLLAANRLLHPGEKRLVEFAQSRCRWCPAGMRADLEALLRAAAPEGRSSEEALAAGRVLGSRIERLLDELDAAMMASGLELPVR